MVKLLILAGLLTGDATQPTPGPWMHETLTTEEWDSLAYKLVPEMWPYDILPFEEWEIIGPYDAWKISNPD